MPAKPVVLPSRTFAKQGEATAFFKAMLARYADGEFLNSDDEDILYELLQRHPEADQKIGAGVQAFFKKNHQIIQRAAFMCCGSMELAQTSDIRPV